MSDQTKYSLEDIASLLPQGAEIAGNKENKYFTKVDSIAGADKDALVFVNLGKDAAHDLIAQSSAEIIICPSDLELTEQFLAQKCFIKVTNPRLTFIQLGNKLFKKSREPQIHETAVIHPKAKIDKSCYIGPFTVVGECEIGAGTQIDGQSYIYDKVKIGKNVQIQAGAIIGADGYGHQADENGKLERFPHVGGVIIEDDVEIGANTCIDCGNLSDTVIGKGSKINNLVTIAHNVIIGQDTLISVNVNINGSAQIGNNSYIGSGVSIRDRKKVGNKVFVGLGAVVVDDVPDNCTVIGNPAKPK
ncbi:MAG: UDP-3-O-(3-hydroxymyristoyl)glucosamine N-acyltransferase [Candidatus Zixiibacteriota bacterium]